MDFSFTQEQEQLRDAVARWVEKSYSFERRRTVVNAGGFDRSLWAELAALGLTALTTSEAHGGLGLGAVDAMVAFEELGRGIVLEPLAAVHVAAATLEHYGQQMHKERWLPQIASGEKIVVIAHQERAGRYSLVHCDATAVKAGDHYRLNAQKNIVSLADSADAFLVSARLEDRQALFLVEAAADGVATSGYICQDGARAGDLALRNAPGTLVTLQAEAALRLAQDQGIAHACAYGVGAMEKTLALTIEYLNTRRQFGVTLSAFQALRHRVADMKMALELARSMSYLATLRLTCEADVRAKACAQAKFQLGESMRKVGQEAVQMHGGIGMTDECVVSHYFKALTQLEMTWGDSLHHLGEVSARMGETAGVIA